MASELLVKRLMMQASVSVLAGLLMSSAALAEDTAGAAGDDGDVSISIDIGDPADGGPDVSIDPVDPGDQGGEDDGVAFGDPGDSSDDGAGDDGAGDDGAGDDGVVDGGEVTVDPVCADCSGMPDVSIDPVDLGEPVENVVDTGVEVTMADGGPRGGQPNERGDDGIGGNGGHEVSRDQGHGEGREADFGWKARQLVK